MCPALQSAVRCDGSRLAEGRGVRCLSADGMLGGLGRNRRTSKWLDWSDSAEPVAWNSGDPANISVLCAGDTEANPLKSLVPSAKQRGARRMDGFYVLCLFMRLPTSQSRSELTVLPSSTSIVAHATPAAWGRMHLCVNHGCGRPML